MVSKNDLENIASGIKKAKLKKAFNPWHEYLKDKILIVGKMFDDYNLIGIVGEKKGIKNLCNYCYENDKKAFEQSGYDNLMNWIEECELGNDGFGFSKDELEILDESIKSNPSIEILENIQKIMSPNGEILVRTADKNQWFVHYFLKLDESEHQTIYRTYTDNLEKELEKVQDIILKKEDDENK